MSHRQKLTGSRCARSAYLASLALAWLTLAAACGSAGWHGTHSGRYKVTVVEASLASHRPDGSPWHVSAPGNTMAVLGGLIGLAVGEPHIGMAVGQALQGGARSFPPSPFVELKIGAATYATLPAGPTLAPRWRYPVAIDARGHDPGESVVILIRDAHDGGVLSQTRLTLGELLAKPMVRLFELGSVVTLDLAVEPLPATPAYSMHEYMVPGDISATRLTERESAQPAAGEWRRVPILNGDVVRVTAGGAVCPTTRLPDTCFDARGTNDTRWDEYRYPEFGNAPHVALVGFYADIPIVIGSQAVFRAQRSGWLLLFVNDTDEDNNSGAFHVRVEVNPPGV